MQKEFIPYEQALELKELGFDKKCMFSYHRNNTEYIDSAYVELANYNANEKLVSAVLYQQAFRWFREKYDGIALIQTHSYGYNGEEFKRSYHPYVEVDGKGYNLGFLPTYEEAELACLKKLIQIVKEK